VTSNVTIDPAQNGGERAEVWSEGSIQEAQAVEAVEWT
jgi:hypothetical protein